MDRVEVYRHPHGKWDWRRISENGRVVSTSAGQGYENKSDAVEMAMTLNPDTELHIEGEDEVKGDEN